MVGISLWGDESDEKALRGKDTFAISSRNYAGDPYTYYLYTITPKQIGKIEKVVRKIRDIGVKVHMQLLSNDEERGRLFLDCAGTEGRALTRWTTCWTAILTRSFPANTTTRSSLRVKCSGVRSVGTNALPSPNPYDTREPQPKRLIHFIRWASDLKTMHRCCTSETRDCSTCKDGAAHMSWVMVNKRAHIRTTKDLQNWIEVYEMFAKLYQFIPW